MNGKRRDTGISVIGALPWGEQLCVLYGSRKDLFDTFALFFNAGLKNNEFCLLIHYRNPTAKEAHISGYPEIPGFTPYIKTGQLEISYVVDMSRDDGTYDTDKAIFYLAGKLDEALGKGYKGMRIAGDPAFGGIEKWRDSIRHRLELKRYFNGAPILGLIDYPLKKLGTNELITLANTVQNVFVNHNGKLSLVGRITEQRPWERFTQDTGEYHLLLRRLKRWGDEVHQYLENAAVILVAIDSTGVVEHINAKGCEILGYGREEIIGKNWVEHFIPDRKKKEAMSIFKKMLAGKINPTAYHVNPVLTKKGEEKIIAWYNTIIRDDQGDIARIYSAGADITAQQIRKENRKMLLGKAADALLSPLHEQYINTGLQGLSDREIIELFFSLNLSPEMAAKVARSCIEKYHSLRDFLAAPVKELQDLGIPRGCVFGLKLIQEVPVRVLKEGIINRPVYSSPQDIFNYLYYSMRDLKNEVFRVIYLNIRNQIIDIADLFNGTSDRININAREVIESALKHDTSSLIFVHNHPSGDPAPSSADKRLTKDLVFVGNLLQIRVLDHIIIGENMYYSFASEGLIKEYELDFISLKISGTAEVKPRLSEAKKELSYGKESGSEHHGILKITD